MKKVFRYLTLMAVPFLLSSCGLIYNLLPRNNSHTSSQKTSESSSQNPSSEASSSEKKDDPSWTIMMYICGADLESTDYKGTEYESYGYNGTTLSGYASQDIDEVLAAKNQPANVNIVLETGGAKKWAKSEIKADELARWHVRDNKLYKDGYFTRASMGNTSTLQSFLEWSFENYPAEKYGLFMWNHGGAMDGCCFDENYSNDSLTANEIDSALTNARKNKNITDKLEFIAYDACLMAVQDIMEINSHHFNYMVASQESEYAGGYDYDAWLPTFYKNTDVDGGVICQSIASTFMKEQNEDAQTYNDYYSLNKDDEDYWPYDQTQSVFDLSKADAYFEAFESFANKLSTIATWSTLKTAINKATKYGFYGEEEFYTAEYNYCYVYNVFDVKEALTEIASSYSSLSSDINKVKTALNDLVIYEEHGKDTSGCGLNLFCPIARLNRKSSIKSQTNFTEWYSLITKSGFGNWVS